MDSDFRRCLGYWLGFDARLRLTQQLLIPAGRRSTASRFAARPVGGPNQYFVGGIMETFLPGLPVQVALAAVAVFGYLFGRYQRTGGGPPSDATRRELKRARAIVNDLEQIA